MWCVSDKLDAGIYPKNYMVQNGSESEKEMGHCGHGTVTESSILTLTFLVFVFSSVRPAQHTFGFRFLITTFHFLGCFTITCLKGGYGLNT